jgi:hypothetical protein
MITRRGKIVLAIIVIALAWWAFDVTTPNECKVPIEQMSAFCKDLLYP